MTVTLRLDTDALNALFPEGSEARVDLQRAVVVNLIAKLAIKDVKHLDDNLVAQAKQIADQAITGFGITTRRGFGEPKVEVDGPVRTAIVEQARLAVAAANKHAVDLAMKEYPPELVKADIELALKRLIEGEAKNGLRDTVRSIIRGI